MQVRNIKESTLLSKLRGHPAGQTPWSDPETAALNQLTSTARTIRRGADIVIQGRAYDSIFLLGEGFALRYRIMLDGRRQVLNVSIPGDTIGYPACFFDKSLYSVSALSKVVVYAISFEEIATIFRDHPRLAVALFWSTAREAAMFGEHLANVGWRSASERLAHFLLEIATRLEAIGLCDGGTFDLPLTQAKLADVLGLSIPHVNRMLRRLREDGLIEMSGPRVRIVNRPALAALAEFNDSYLTCMPPQRATAHLRPSAINGSRHLAAPAAKSPAHRTA